MFGKQFSVNLVVRFCICNNICTYIVVYNDNVHCLIILDEQTGFYLTDIGYTYEEKSYKDTNITGSRLENCY